MTNPPLLVVVIMVKNEAEAIVNTLTPFAKGGVTHMCVFDTGSTDNTVEITRKFFEDNHINGFIDQEPFVDFATSRNRALEFAESHFPDAAFFIVPDADWYIQNVPRLIEFCTKHKAMAAPLYLMQVRLGDIQYCSSRLFRVSARNRYVGAVHEVPETHASEKVYYDVYFEHTITNTNKRKSETRYQRDAALLLKDVEKNPTQPRSLFYLAQTYECMLDLKNAYKYYLKRSRISGWIEEDFVTLYRLGVICEQLSQTEDAFTWHMALDYYLKAVALRPTRIEPLVKIAQHYTRENPQIAAIYMKHACSVPYPKDDLLFVLKEMYDYTRYEILSICAWYIGEYELGKKAAETALKTYPNNTTLKNNLKIYDDYLKSQYQYHNSYNPAVEMSRVQ